MLRQPPRSTRTDTRFPYTPRFLSIDQRDDLPPGVEVFRIAGPFFFGVAGELLDTLRRLGQSPRVIILRLRLMPLLDASGAQALEEFIERSEERRVGKECVSTCSSRWSPYHSKKNNTELIINTQHPITNFTQQSYKTYRNKI